MFVTKLKMFAAACLVERVQIFTMLGIGILLLLLGGCAEEPASAKKQVPTRPAAKADLISVGKSGTSEGVLASLEEKIDATYKRVASATVYIYARRQLPPTQEYHWRHHGSGTIISDDGLIFTHGHHGLGSQTPLKIVLGDGSTATGKVLGVHEPYDISLVQLDETGPWPAVPLGACDTLKLGDHCLALGFPIPYSHGPEPGDQRRPPLLRLARFLRVSSLEVLSSSPTYPGDSGGPLFTLSGELVGVHGLAASDLHGAGHARVDLYREVRDDLLAGKHVKTILTGPFEGADEPMWLADAGHRSVVSVRTQDRQVGFGLIVAANGLIVTKASELTQPISCRLQDGREFKATLRGTSRKHDLALLEIEATGLLEAAWSEREPKPGMILAVLSMEPQPLGFGAAGSSVLKVPGERGVLGFDVEDAESGAVGLKVKEISKQQTRKVVRVGDIVTHIENSPISTAREFYREQHVRLDPTNVVIGETVQLTIQRDGATIQIMAPVESGSGGSEREPDLDGRHSGFPAVFIHHAKFRRQTQWLLVSRADLGGPVVDSQGKVLGINIGSIHGYFTYAVPAKVVHQVVDELRQQSGARK